MEDTNPSLRPMHETLESIEDAALGVLNRLLQVAFALRDLAPAQADTRAAGTADVAIIDEYSRLTVECLPFTVLDVALAARELRHDREPWSGQHRRLSDLCQALLALVMSRSRLSESVDALTRVAPATGALIGEAASYADTVARAISPLIEL